MVIDQFKIQGQVHDIGAAAENVSFDKTNTDYSNNDVQNVLVEIDSRFTDIIQQNTTEGWNAQPNLKAKRNCIYVYTDHCTYNNKNIPAMKIGDGTSYLIDMPFVDEHTAELYAHINNNTVHITAAEREFWNNKIRCDETATSVTGDTLVLTIH